MKRNKRKQSEVTDNPNENSPDMWGRKKRRKGIIEYGSGDSGSRSLSTQVIDNSNFPHELLTGATKKPSTTKHPASVFPAGPSGVVTSNPTPHTEYFSGAHHFTIYKPTMIEGDSTNERQSMKLLAEHAIVGAEFDSSDHRPSCYPETRLDISRSIQSWMRNHARKHKILWLHGPAGVGKSAILQTVAETEADSPTPILGATLFFSRPNSRDDPQCVFITIAYRLAVIYPPYRHYIVKLFALDPRLIEKSMREQFKAFIVRPFAEEKLMDGLHDTVLILLDGLDECKGEEAQREIISLVGRFSLQYPTSPLIWLFASRPEPHIRGAFASEGVQLSYEEIQVFVDSDQARRDVETYLRASFAKIQKRYPQSISSSLQQWPSELDFSTIATRSSGLFIFPSTIVRFIGDTAYADPESRLKTVLEVIESTSSSGGGYNPFETLDALYTRILSEIPRDALSTTLGLLAMYAARFDLGNFALNCNWLGITQGRAYGALQRLHSVLEIPEPQNALTEDIQASHASFYDYLLSPSRSGAFYVIAPEIVQHLLLRWIRILLESHSIETSDVDVTRIKLSWPIANKEDRLHIQRRSFGWSLDLLMSVLDEFVNDSVRNEFSRLAVFFRDLDFGEVVDYVGMFNMLVYPESVFAMNLKHWGVLRTIPLQSFNFNDIRFDLDPKIGRYKERGVSLRVAWGTAGQGDTVPVWERILRYARIVNNQGEVPADFWGTNLSDRPTWKADLQKNLATWTDKAPSHPITMLGRGRKSCACFQFHVPGELWVLTLPCVQSS